MRSAFSSQLRLDCQPIEQLRLNLDCRDEIIPVLEALKHVFCQSELRDQLIRLVASDVNESTRHDVGREGFDYWQISVLAVDPQDQAVDRGFQTTVLKMDVEASLLHAT